jgi:hypothetical protein
MRPHEIESWALATIDRVVRGQPVEDSRVELKAEWPRDPARAARRLAGHANAARQEAILWLIGVDEGSSSVPGADYANLAFWWPQVVHWFDGVAPAITDVNVPYDGQTVAALCFETDRAPYVVNVSEQGPTNHEVPWREATRVRSAKREELLRMLVPALREPEIEVLKAEYESQSAWGAGHFECELYVIPCTTDRICIPMHRCAGELVTASAHFSLMDLSPAESPQDAMVQVSPHQAVLTGPGRLRLTADVSPVAEVREPVRVMLRFGIIEIERPVTLEIALTPRNPGQDKRWVHRASRER